MLDTSALLAALVSNHELHVAARRHLPRPSDARLPGIVLAETFARLRGAPFQLSAAIARDVLQPWAEPDAILATPPSLYRRALDDAPGHNLGGQIHDYLIILTCLHHGHGLVTADRRQADLARELATSSDRPVLLIT